MQPQNQQIPPAPAMPPQDLSTPPAAQPAAGPTMPPMPSEQRRFSKKKLILVIVAVLIVASVAAGAILSGTKGHKYPSSARNDFISGCTESGATQSACECTISYFEQHVSYSDFSKYATQGENGTLSPTSPFYQTYKDAVTACNVTIK